MNQLQRVKIGEQGLSETYQQEFPETTKCVHCGKEARIGFVMIEHFPEGRVAIEKDKPAEFVCELHFNEAHSMWLHDLCAVAVYFCKECLEVTALWNQA